MNIKTLYCDQAFRIFIIATEKYTTSIQAVKDIAETTMIIATLVDQYNIYHKELKIEK